MALVFSILWISLNWGSPDHAIYIGVIEIQHIAEIPSATVRVKVFSDDLHSAVRNKVGAEIDPVVEMLCLTGTEQVLAYFQEHLTLSVNGNELALENTACSFEGDAHWLDFTVQCPTNWESISIEADFFMEIYPTQTQMIHMNENGKNYTLRLTKSRVVKSIAFQN